MTKTYDFALRFRLPKSSQDPSSWIDRLYEAGCDDATIGLARRGSIGLMFSRRASKASKAVASAIADVRRAIKGAELIGAEPDLVNLADLAKYVGCTRQNLRKYAVGEARKTRAAFPPPTIVGPDSYWHLAEIGAWIGRHTPLKIDPALIEVAFQTSKVNLREQSRRLRKDMAA